MIRYGNLWPQVINLENLYQASRQAQQGKRFRDNVLEFNYNLENELFKLQQELQTKTYIPGDYRSFRIYDPKPRMISAAPYRDRVMHHALCNIIVPVIERSFIFNSYANRLGFGTHRALECFVKYARSSRYVLQCDIAKYFPSIDHEILKQIIRRKIKCRNTLWLIDTIIDGSNPQEPVFHYFPGDNLLTPLSRRIGLPIGNLTSQFFANCYLNGFDHFVQEKLGVSKYLRYVDDFALFSDDRDVLVAARIVIEEYLVTLRLKVHPIKSQLFETQYGANFVGFRILSAPRSGSLRDHIRVRSDNLRRGRERLKKYQQDYAQGHISLEQLIQCLQSWSAHLAHGNTYNLRQKIFESYSFSRLE